MSSEREGTGPRPGEGEGEDEDEDASSPSSLTPLQRLLRPGWTDEIEATGSPGEVALPFLRAATEACWFESLLIGLAGVDFLGSPTALLPFWGPPLLLGASLWLFQRALYREAEPSPQASSSTSPTDSSAPGASPGFALLFVLPGLLIPVLTWLHVYTGLYFLLDPRWLLAFASDVLSLNTHFYQTVAIVAGALYLCWRATRLAQEPAEPGRVRRQLWIGLLVLSATILLRAGFSRTGGNIDDLVLVLLIPIFLYCALSAHALARLAFLRRAHPFGFEGRSATQERAILSIMGGMGLLLLVLTLLGGVLFSSAFFASLHPAWQALAFVYDRITYFISLLVTWLVTPFFWFFSWLSTLMSQHAHSTVPASSATKIPPYPVPSVDSPGIILAGKFVLPLLLLLLLAFLLWLALRRRRRLRITRGRAGGDVHTSVWSWALFWRQFKAFWTALFRRRGSAGALTDEDASAHNLPAASTARTVREIYRALLAKAAALGSVRRRSETPGEFQQRLDQLPTLQSEPQLAQLTEVYILTRYGGNVPDEQTLAQASRSWQELKQKWEMPHAQIITTSAASSPPLPPASGP